MNKPEGTMGTAKRVPSFWESPMYVYRAMSREAGVLFLPIFGAGWDFSMTLPRGHPFPYS